jgi:membrane associated rhomboid family serine protease
VNSHTPIATLVIAGITTFLSIRAFRDSRLKDRLIFHPESILAGREYHRLVTCSFLHADWMHLVMNMVTLVLFGDALEPLFGASRVVIIYVSGVVGGSLLSLYLHRHHEYYALGASGGVCGILFSSIFLLPGGEIRSMMVPFGIPGWLYAILFLVFEFRGLRRQESNIGHDAHLGGAIVGLLVTTAMYPAIVRMSPWLYAIVLTLCLVMFLYFWKNPTQLPISAFLSSRRSRPAPKPRAATPTAEEIDAILDKVSRHGIQSLTAEEKRTLHRASGKAADATAAAAAED